MKLLLLGGTGLLGQAFAAVAARRGWAVRCAARRDAELCCDLADAAALAAVLVAEAPDLVVNCAALVDVGACERDPAAAYLINARPLGQLAEWSRAAGRPFVHVSTDHFFADGGARAHREDEPVELVNEYARSKFAAEAFALTAPRALVLRTSIVGIRGWGSPTFAEWALAALESGERMTLFGDAFTSSIDVGAFAEAALDLAGRGAAGLFNLAAGEVYSKEQFVRELARQLGLLLDAAAGSVAALRPRRPASLGLDVARAERYLGRPLPGLAAVVAAVVAQHRESHDLQGCLQDR